MDPYEARQDVIENMLLEELEAQSHVTYVAVKLTEVTRVTVNMCHFEHSDQEECDHVSAQETDSDEDNVTASDYSDTDSETEEGCEEKVDKSGINYFLL